MKITPKSNRWLFLPIVWFLASSSITILTSFYLLRFHPFNVTEFAKTHYGKFSSAPLVLGISTTNFSQNDARSLVLRNYFTSQESPLAPYGDFFVYIADKNGLDWTLLPAIAMQESNAGKHVPENSFNPFGWAIHSNMSLKFSSWEEAIETVGKGIKEEYASQGLVTIDQINSRYNPISYQRDKSWGKGVEYFMNLLKNY